MTETPAPQAPDQEMAPGGPAARDHGCTCSVLANAAYRARREQAPLVEPGCPLHAML